MYEQVSRGIQLICCLAAASLKFISFATFVVAVVDGVGFNFNCHFSPPVYVVVDTTFLMLSCQCATSPKFVAINGFQLKLSIYLWKRFLQSCGYYIWSCGYEIILWIVDTILLHITAGNILLGWPSDDCCGCNISPFKLGDSLEKPKG